MLVPIPVLQMCAHRERVVWEMPDDLPGVTPGERRLMCVGCGYDLGAADGLVDVVSWSEDDVAAVLLTYGNGDLVAEVHVVGERVPVEVDRSAGPLAARQRLVDEVRRRVELSRAAGRRLEALRRRVLPVGGAW